MDSASIFMQPIPVVAAFVGITTRSTFHSHSKLPTSGAWCMRRYYHELFLQHDNAKSVARHVPIGRTQSPSTRLPVRRQLCRAPDARGRGPRFVVVVDSQPTRQNHWFRGCRYSQTEPTHIVHLQSASLLIGSVRASRLPTIGCGPGSDSSL